VQKQKLVVLAGPLLALFLVTTVAVCWPVEPAAASGPSDTWLKTRTTTLLKTTRLRERQVGLLLNKVQRRGGTARLRRATLARKRSVVRLNRAVSRLNAAVLAGDHVAGDPLVTRLVRLNRRVRALDTRSARLARRARVPRMRAHVRTLLAARSRLVAGTVRLGKMDGSSSVRVPAATQPQQPVPPPASSPGDSTPRNDAPSSPPPTTSTITDLELRSGQSGITYENVRFLSSRSFQQATVTITRASHITFRGCVFEGSAWNGITINDFGGTVRDITFIDCYVKSSARMGFECTSRGSDTSCYSRVDLRRVTFDPQGSEAISYDGPPVHTDCTVEDVLIRGSGIRPDLFPWGHGMEINGPRGFLVQDLTMYRTRGSNWNLNGKDGVDMDWTFHNIVVDNTVDHLGSVTRHPDANMICAFNVERSEWIDCTFRNARPGAAAAYLSDCDRNRFDGIALSGMSQQISEVDGCSGNIW
jgi:hypothetical protein